jgi:uncharacterized protein (TIGR02246 family)
MSDFVVAESAIRQLHSRYIDSVWRKDYDAFGNCFAEDCQWRIGGMMLEGRKNIVDGFIKLTDRFAHVLVTLRTPIVHLTGKGTASARTYLTEQNVFKDGTAYAPIGMYYEHFVDEGDQWRFKWRLFQAHYVGPPDMSGKFIEQPDYGPPPNMPPRDAMPNVVK